MELLAQRTCKYPSSRAVLGSARNGKEWRAPRFRVPHSSVTKSTADSLPAGAHSQMLRRSTKDLDEYCPTSSNPAACYEVQEWLRYKVEAVEACLSGGDAGISREDAHKLERVVYETAATGSLESLYRVLTILKHHEDDQRAGRKPELSSLATPVDGEAVQRRERLTKLFESLDKQHVGTITWDEFNRALDMLNDHLEESELELIGSTLDLQGHVTLEQFLAIAEEAEWDKQAKDAHFLRSLTHKSPSESIPENLQY